MNEAYSDHSLEDEEVPISQHVDGIAREIVNGSNSLLKSGSAIQQWLSRQDAFIEIEGEAQLPPLEWNRNFRKAYTILAWVRPEMSGEVVAQEQAAANANAKTRQVLYRFATSAEDSRGAGICVLLGNWMLKNDMLHTTATAYLLPTMSQQTAMQHASLLQIPLVLPPNQWSLLGISHVFPYLKRSTLELTVNGSIVGTGELTYPVVDTNVVMEYASLFGNIGRGGVSVKSSLTTNDDSRTPAFKLSSSSTATIDKKLALKWHVATLALHPDGISCQIQALCAHAGVALSLQNNGRVLVPLPPISNSSKGMSLNGGPSVGIPLSTDVLSLELQQKISRVVLHVSATNAYILKTRIVCPFVFGGGHFESTPKVGLMQPSIPLNVEAAVHFIHSKVVHALSDFLLMSEEPNLSVVETSHCLSVVFSEQYLVESMVLPFFLALPPLIPELQQPLYDLSLKQLWRLYTNNGERAAELLTLLTLSIQYGGARCHEQVLQGGLMTILSTTLRRSLVRYSLLKVSEFSSCEEFIKSVPPMEPNIHPALSPKRIPLSIAQACAELIGACCGPPAPTLVELAAHDQVRRNSDLALTAIFGLALDLDLWGVHVASAKLVIRSVAERYGGPCIAYGSILRNQIPVQSLMDMIRIRLDVLTEGLEEVANSFASLMESMLLASLSNKRNIAMAERDIKACIDALSDCALGTVGAHVILVALHRILIWCDVVPSSSREAAGNTTVSADDDAKLQVATRLGRNLLMGQYHDVLAPMLLSRTVFCGERVLAKSEHAPHLWQYHWRLSLLLFVWVSSISGPEGHAASKSTGSLLFASGLAGSLHGCLVANNDRDNRLIASLLLPPPALALTVNTGSNNNRDTWNYTDLLSERLQVVVPLLPGLIVSLLSHPADVTVDTPIADECMDVLTELLTTVTTSFHRVFGGSTLPRTHHSSIVKAAKDHAPQLVMVIMLLESHIHLRKPVSVDESIVILKCRKPKNDGEWVQVPNNGDETLVYGSSVKEPPSSENDSLVEKLIMCQRMVMNSLTDLITSAMKLGGGEASTAVWRNVAVTLNESVLYGAVSTLPDVEEPDAEKVSSETMASSSHDDDDDAADTLARNILCRIAAFVLTKAQKRSQTWEVWGQQRSAGVARLCNLVEEKELLQKPFGETNGSSFYSPDQVLLLCALLDVMAYGRDMTGWCQLILPTPPALDSGIQGDDDIAAGMDGSVASSLLQVLQPSLRVVLGCLGSVKSNVEIIIPQEHTSRISESTEAIDLAINKASLLLHMTAELKETLTAAIVGLSFPNARDVALNGLASIRRATINYRNASDTIGVEACSSLFVLIVEEIRVRYEGERRLRETALFDAYEGGGDTSNYKFEADASREVERLILGGDLIPKSTKKKGQSSDSIEEIRFDADGPDTLSAETLKRAAEGEDFILFHGAFKETAGKDKTGETHKAVTTMAYAHYEGLGSTLEECKMLMAGSSEDQTPKEPSAEALLGLLSPYLDTWDENAARDAAESELVEWFDSSARIDGSNKATRVLAKSDSPVMSAQQLPIFGSETAADAMSSFIEISSGEKSRLNEVISTFMPSHRHSCMAYAERFCWARYMEITEDGTDFSMDNLLERGVADGNRDIRSRLISMPCQPQFQRHIPSYLDNTTSHDDAGDTGKQGQESDKRTIKGDDMFDKSSITELMAAGNIEIKDITKKVIDEDELHDIWEASDELVDESENPHLGDVDFSERSLEASEQGAVDNTDRATNSAAASGDKEPSSPDADDDLTGRAVDKAHLSSYSFRAHIASTAFSDPPDNSASMLSLLHSATPGVIEEHFDTCVHVKTEGNRKCTLLLTSTHLILEYDADSEGWFDGEMLSLQEEADRQRRIEEAGGGKDNSDIEETKDDLIQQQLEHCQKETAALRPKSIRWNLSELSHVYLRRYRLRDSALEMFFLPSGGSSFGGFGLYSPGTSLFLDFGSGHEGNISRDDAAHSIMRRAPPQAITQWPDRSPQFLHDQLSRLTVGWVDGRITNFDYLLHLNMLAGRSYNDLCQYPVMPWVLSNYESEEIPDLTDRSNFRDLSKPMGALNPERLEEFIERFESFSDPTIPPFMYGSHYSTSAGVVLHFLVRMHPFAGMHRQLQGGHFDVADRLFSSVPRTWEMCTGTSAAEVKELTPEWYCNPAFLKNTNNFKLGTSQEGEMLGDVMLPPWANGSPETFVEVMRNALESDICSEMLPDWIDLIFGRKQQGPEAVDARNVFFYLTYYGSVDVASIEDESLRAATELQIAHFGQCPMQLFFRPHVRRVQRMRNYRKLSFYQMLSAYTQGAAPVSKENEGDSDEDYAIMESPRSLKADGSQRVFGEPLILPFFSAPMSHWVHLEAPPPGPHAALIALRLAGTDRVLAIDAQGIFHSFRWAWKPEILDEDYPSPSLAPIDKGCFVAQRELPGFRSVPRIPHVPRKRPGEEGAMLPAVAISKTLFASRSVLLVLSDADGRGALSMQLVDPAKGDVKGEAMVPSVHSSRITCISMDPIGTAAGHGGVGGELAIVGSADGGTSLWRFMSSHYLPLRPRVRMRGHGGSKVQAVALSSAIHICASVSANRCCIFSVGNGNIIRSFPPPKNTLEVPEAVKTKTVFADTPALALSVQGFVVTVCQTTILSEEHRNVITLELFSLEGLSLGSKALESWRGVPHKITCTPDGTAITVCSGRGVTIHRLSAITPLEFIDEWHITEADELDEKTPAAWDVDFGPSLLRPVVAAAACSSGVLRLHALPGISPWSERHKKSSWAVGKALSKPAQKIKTAVGRGLGFGQKYVGVGKEIGKEVSSDVKERGVGGFLAGTMFRRKSTKK